MHIFLSALEHIPDPRAENARPDLGELLVIAFVSVLCGATSCAEMSAFGRAKESIFRDFLKLKHAIPSHDTFSLVFRMIDPKALDAAFGQVLADVSALLREGDVIAIDGKSLRGARDKGESARTRMMVSAYAFQLDLRAITELPGRAFEKLITPLLDLVRMDIEILRQLDQGLHALDRRRGLNGKTHGARTPNHWGAS